MSERMSPARQLLELVWENQGYQMGHSWGRLNYAMRSAAYLTIKYGLEFHPDDFTTIAKRFRIGYWGGKDGHMCGEDFYSLACDPGRGTSNRSAAISFETWKGRKPFILDRNKRIAVGTRFKWYGETVLCTSFTEDGEYLVACSYHDRPRDERGYVSGPVKVKHRYKISHTDIRDCRTARRKQKELAKRMTAMDANPEIRPRMNDLGEWVRSQFGDPINRPFRLAELAKLEEKLDELAA